MQSGWFQTLSHGYSFCHLCGHHSHQISWRNTSLLMYMSSIAKLSQKFKWPSWVIYDYSYWQDTAETNKTNWPKVDAEIHVQCFNNIAKSLEGGCHYCHSLDHISDSCSVKPLELPKRCLPNPSTPQPERWVSPRAANLQSPLYLWLRALQYWVMAFAMSARMPKSARAAKVTISIVLVVVLANNWTWYRFRHDYTRCKAPNRYRSALSLQTPLNKGRGWWLHGMNRADKSFIDQVCCYTDCWQPLSRHFKWITRHVSNHHFVILNYPNGTHLKCKLRWIKYSKHFQWPNNSQIAKTWEVETDCWLVSVSKEMRLMYPSTV